MKHMLILSSYDRVNPSDWLGGLTPTHIIRKRHNHINTVISNQLRGGIILLIQSLRCGVEHGNFVSMSSYLAETKIYNIVSITVVHAEVCKPKYLLELLMCGLCRISYLLLIYLPLINLCWNHYFFFACHSCLLEDMIIFFASSDMTLQSDRKWPLNIPHPRHFPLGAFLTAAAPPCLMKATPPYSSLLYIGTICGLYGPCQYLSRALDSTIFSVYLLYPISKELCCCSFRSP